MRIGICFDQPEEYPHIEGPVDRFAEFEPETTISAMQSAVRYCGHEPVLLGGPFRLLAGRPDVDLIWNIAEGYGTRNREGWVPTLCEMYGIPFLGSDALTLSWSLDKALTKQLARSLGIPTADWQVCTTATLPADLALNPSAEHPLFAKPRYEGTAKGITETSVIRDMNQLEHEIHRLESLYRQDVLVEEFLPGAEYTVALSGSPLSAYPVLERGVDRTTGIGVHVMEALGRGGDYQLWNQLHPDLEDRLKGWSMQLCQALNVRDFARLDFKCDTNGDPFFLEINPLPTFAIDNTFAILAELQGVAYEVFLGEILRVAIGRHQG